MKTKLLFLILIMFALNGPIAVFASDNKPLSGNSSVPANTENKLTKEEVARLNSRVEEIRHMDKSTLTSSEKRELRKELKGIKERVKKDSGYIYVSGSLLLLIIILLIVF